MANIHKFQQVSADSIYQMMNAFYHLLYFLTFCLSPDSSSLGSPQGKKASISQSVTLSSLLSATPFTLSLPYCITSFLSSRFFFCRVFVDVGTSCGMLYVQQAKIV